MEYIALSGALTFFLLALSSPPYYNNLCLLFLPPWTLDCLTLDTLNMSLFLPAEQQRQTLETLNFLPPMSWDLENLKRNMLFAPYISECRKNEMGICQPEDWKQRRRHSLCRTVFRRQLLMKSENKNQKPKTPNLTVLQNKTQKIGEKKHLGRKKYVNIF